MATLQGELNTALAGTSGSTGNAPRLIFLNRYFHPDRSATSQLLTDLAVATAGHGWIVSVITSRQLYDDPAAVLPARELWAGVDIRRVRTSRLGRSILVARAVDYATFYVASAWTLWRLARRGDIVVVKTDPPLLSLFATPVAALRRAHLVNWHQDIFPEVAQAVLGERRPWIRHLVGPLRWARNALLRRSAMNVVLGGRMADTLMRLGVPQQRIRSIPNWADGASIHPVAAAANALRREWAGDGAFVIAYSGNLGRAHEFRTFLDAAERLETGATIPSTIARTGTTPGSAVATHSNDKAPDNKALPRIKWLFIGGGALHRQLAEEAKRRDLPSVTVLPYQPRERLAESLSAADAHLVTLRPDLEGLIVPSKYYGIAAAGRPAIFVGDADGEIARMLARDGCGFTTPLGDGAQLAEQILEMARNPELAAAMGARARAAFEARHDVTHALATWEALLLEIPALSG